MNFLALSTLHSVTAEANPGPRYGHQGSLMADTDTQLPDPHARDEDNADQDDPNLSSPWLAPMDAEGSYSGRG